MSELSAGYEDLRTRYQQLPDGGRITCTTDDPELVDALHRWFQAQLDGHGSHAHN